MTIVRDGHGEVITDSNPLPIRLSDAGAMQPIDIQSHYTETIQTHNAVSIPATTGNSISPSWISCNGFDQIAITLLNDASTNSTLEILWSHDGSNHHGTELIMPSATGQRKSAITPIKAIYFKLAVYNTDASAHVMSAWAYLKA